MKKLLLVIGFIISIVMVNAQSPQFKWVKNFNESGWDYGTGLSVDASGNVYSIGNIESSSFIYKTLVVKQDASGNILWSKEFKGASNTLGSSIAVDGSGNIYFTGSFSGPVDFDPGSGTYNLTPDSLNDVYITKLSSAGNFVWARKIGGKGNDGSSSLTLDASGNVYTTGSFRGTVDFDPGAGTFDLVNGVFLLKLDASGNFVWAGKMGGYSEDYATSLTLDASGNQYIAGICTGTQDYDPGAGVFNLTSAGLHDAFVMKLDASNNFVWAKRFGGNDDDEAACVAVDATGNVYTTGFFQLTADFDPGANVSNLISGGNEDIFISKLDASGNFVWAKRMGETSSDIGRSIAIDASGVVYSTGTFYNTVDFNPGTGVNNHTSNGHGDIYFSKLDATGNYLWSGSMGSTLFIDYGISIKVDASGNIYSVGTFGFRVDFDPGSAIFNIDAGNQTDMYVLKWGTCPAIDVTTTLTGKTIKANLNGASYQWVDCNNGNAPISGKTSQSYSPIVSGNYAVIVTVGGCSSTSACTKVTGTNIKGISGIETYSIYPNPTNGLINISLSNPGKNCSIEVFNSVGTLVARLSDISKVNTIDLNEQANGLYIVKVINNNYLVATQKIVLHR